MPKKKFALESDGPQRLEIKWKGGWFYIEGDAEVLFDGVSIGMIPHAELGNEKEFRLPDDSSLRVSFVDRNPCVFRDGKSLVAIAHPRRALESMSNLFLFIAVGHILMVPIKLIVGEQIVKVAFITINFSRSLTASITINLVYGVSFFLLAVWARQKSYLAVILGMALLAVQVVLELSWENQVNLSSIFDLIAAIILMGGAVYLFRKLVKGKLPVIK